MYKLWMGLFLVFSFLSAGAQQLNFFVENKTVDPFLDKDNIENRGTLPDTKNNPLSLLTTDKCIRNTYTSIPKLEKDTVVLPLNSSAGSDTSVPKKNEFKVTKFLLSGVTFQNRAKQTSLFVLPLTELFSYNTIEGFVINTRVTFTQKLDTFADNRRSFSITPEYRYGFGNKHANFNLVTIYRFGKKHSHSVMVGGGSDVFQFNNANPISVLGSTFSTLVNERNRMKLYEARFGTFNFSKGISQKVNLIGAANYQDRIPLENTSYFSFFDKEDRAFSPNYPDPLSYQNIDRHQAFSFTVGMRWQPGVYKKEVPFHNMDVDTIFPVITLSYTQGVKNIFNSDVEYKRWLIGLSDDFDLQKAGQLKYRLTTGGFLSKKSVQIPDFIHYRGNFSFLTNAYLTRFQLVPHYYLSHTSRFYTSLFAEHHYNGLITNQLPLLRKLKWNLLTGLNALYTEQHGYYIEPFVGLENIFNMFRIDYVWGFEKNMPVLNGFKIGIKRPIDIN